MLETFLTKVYFWLKIIQFKIIPIALQLVLLGHMPIILIFHVSPAIAFAVSVLESNTTNALDARIRLSTV